MVVGGGGGGGLGCVGQFEFMVTNLAFHCQLRVSDLKAYCQFSAWVAKCCVESSVKVDIFAFHFMSTIKRQKYILR